jgi:hypothetical protein
MVVAGIAWIFGVDKVEPLVWDEASLRRPGAPDYARA